MILDRQRDGYGEDSQTDTDKEKIQGDKYNEEVNILEEDHCDEKNYNTTKTSRITLILKRQSD